MQISARNQLPGVVETVLAGEVVTEVTVRLKGGEGIVSTITTSSARRLQLEPGKKVTVIIKASEVILGTDDA